MVVALRTGLFTLIRILNRSLMLALFLAGSGVAPVTMAGVPALAQPDWAQLSAGQRTVLAPLSNEWNTMESFRRKKWLGIAERYASLSGEEQMRVQRRMQDWAKLAPEERRLAREKFKTLQKVTPEMRESLRQNWEDYKALPEDEKARLKATTVMRAPVSIRPPPPPKPSVTHKIKPAANKNASVPPTIKTRPVAPLHQP